MPENELRPPAVSMLLLRISASVVLSPALHQLETTDFMTPGVDRRGRTSQLQAMSTRRRQPIFRVIRPLFLLLILAWFLGQGTMQVLGGEWITVQVPGAWEDQGGDKLRTLDGFAWYRAWIKPHDSFFTRHERNLFEESVSFNIRGLADAHELFINGKRLGGAGRFAPAFESGRDGFHRHKIPPGLLGKGEWNEVLIRVYNASGPGGFLSEAPFVMDYFNECVLEGAWEFHPGDGEGFAAGALKERPARAAFDQFRDSSRVLGEAGQLIHGPRLTPQESAKLFKTDPEYAVDAMLSEPLVAQPTHLSFDERGRLWVSQYRQYPYPAGLKMLSRDKYYRARYDKIPPPPPNHDRGRDRITIHEDTDGDGVFDRHKVFVDGLNMANAAVRGRGGVWVMNTPYLLFYPDRNFDDLPDGPPVVHLSGFGLEDTHSVANGLVWGMDGWLYGGQGSTTTSRVIRPDLDPAGSPGVYYEGCMVWRYHPESRTYEVFAEGSGNTFGLEVDSEGRLFSGHNGGETRGWHYVPGGFYLKQGKDPGKFGPSRNPYTFGELPFIKPVSAVQRFSHLFAVGEGTALPASGRGKLFSIDPLHSLVVMSERRVSGSTFETLDVGPALTSDDSGFRPVFILNGADGALYVGDFYEHYIAHGQHYQSQIDPTTGRIYRLRGKAGRLETDLNLEGKSSLQLVGLLGHANKWHRHTAVRLLGERRDESVLPRLHELLKNGSEQESLGALWSLFQMGRAGLGTLMDAANHPSPAVRLWAVRFAGERFGVNAGLGTPHTVMEPTPRVLLERLQHLALEEPNAEVRCQIAATARRLPVAERLDLLFGLATREVDLSDPMIPLMIWWGVEHSISQAREAVVSRFESRGLWEHSIVQEQLLPRIMRRFAAAGTLTDYTLCARLLEMAPGDRHRRRLIEGFEEAFKGRSASGLPTVLLQAIARAGGQSIVFRLRTEGAAALQDAIQIARDTKAAKEIRLSILKAIAELRLLAGVPLLLELAGNANQGEIERSAISAMAAFEEDRVSEFLLKRLPGLSAELRLAALNTLASRPRWAAELLRAFEAGSLAGVFVAAEISDRLVHHSNPDIAGRAAKVFRRSTPAGSPNQAERMGRIQAEIRAAPGDPYAGERIFSERCAGCHKLFHKGGNVGPDLTPYQRDHFETLLTAILNPNAEIREGYAAVEVETRDGRSITGFAVDQDANVMMIRSLSGELLTIPLGDVVRREPTGRSLMPEGLIDDLDGRQIRDFFAYLRSSQPFTR